MSAFQDQEPWEMYYWAYMREDGKNHMVGRGEFVRLMFELAGVSYTDYGVTKDGMPKVVEFLRGGGNVDFPVFAPPAIKRGYFVLSQTPAIVKFLGKEFGFYPQNSLDEAHADSLNAMVTDFVAEGRLVFHSKTFTGSYSSQVEEVKPTIAWFENERLGKFMSYLESVNEYNAKSNPQGYFIGASLTYVDIAVFHALCAAESQFPERYAQLSQSLPHLVAFKDKIASIPNIAAYLASDRRGLFAGDSMM
mmetsp:Transcript_10248/g.19104  ORF Transcript_10248/g.19104 Transcript_10248/m.19104 type:complete len:249 (-) Transcript_10248:275-1021(-)